MEDQDIYAILKEQFHFLRSDLGFKCITRQKDTYFYTLVYANKTVGVSVHYEIKESYLIITLYQLKNGVGVKGPRFVNINPDAMLNKHGLEDIVSYRNPSAFGGSIYGFQNHPELHDEKKGLFVSYVIVLANNLKEYAADVLTGDFEIFKEMDKIVEERKNV